MASEVIPHGLHNSGSICYMNSLVQALLSCKAFIEAVGSMDLEKGSDMLKLFRDVIRTGDHRSGALVAELLIRNVSKDQARYFGGGQQCALEALDFILNMFPKDFKTEVAYDPKITPNPIRDVFDLRYVTQTVRIRAIDGKPARELVEKGPADPPTIHLAIADTFVDASSKESLDSSIFSDRCKYKIDVLSDYKPEDGIAAKYYKEYHICHIGEVVIMYLARFTEIDHMKEYYYPDEISFLRGDRSAKMRYRLVATVNHSGSAGGNSSGGHYVAFVKRSIKGKTRLFLCNDSDVRELDKFPLESRSAFLLFYAYENDFDVKSTDPDSAAAGAG